MTDKTYIGYIKCPIGIVEINTSKTALNSVKIISKESIIYQKESRNYIIKETKKQIKEYFKHKRKVFEIELAFNGTEFQNKVWLEIYKIPYGKTKTYGQIAKDLGSKKLTRAVGSANGKNPFWIIIPCHRVVGSKNELVGYAGGLWRKQWLLEHESNESRLFK